MSDLLRKWMKQDIGVTVSINNFEKDFANGYAFGELLYRCNLQPDFEQFIESSSPDAVLKNFTRLQPTLAKLGVPLDSRTVDSIQKGQKGVVGRVIYAIKVAVDGLEKELCAPVTMSSSLRGTSTLRASHTLLESRKWKQEKMIYDSKMVSIFEESLRRRSLNPNTVMESLHLRKFTEEAIRQDKSDSDGKRTDKEEKERKRDMRRQHQRTMQKQRQEYMKGRENENIKTWIKNRARMRSLEAADLEREMQYLQKLEATKERKNREAELETRLSIEDFEKTMSRKSIGSESGSNIDTQEGNVLLETLERGSMPSLEHMQYLRTKVPSAEEMEANARAYMSRMRAKKAEESIARKERERRRRHTILEHQKHEERLESERKADTILHTISRRSELESKTQTNLEMLLQEHKIMKENKAFRESQYAARYEADEKEAMIRESALAAAVKEDFLQTTDFEKQKWQETQEENKRQRAYELKCFAHDTVWQLLGLAERCIEYRELSEQNNTSALVPRKEWREWKTMLLLGKKLVEAPPLTEPILESSLNIALDEAALQDYMVSRGEWDIKGNSFANDDKPIGTNIPFGNMILDLSQMADASEDSFHITTSHLRCKIAIIGKPFAGQSVIARRVAEKYNLVYLNVDAIVKESVTYANVTDENEAQESQENESTETESKNSVPQLSALNKERKRLGKCAENSLLEGNEIDDAVIVDLIINAVERLCPPPTATEISGNEGQGPDKEAVEPAFGFILDSFPRTCMQAKLLERRLTGLNLDEEAAKRRRLSTLAPPEPGKLKPLQVSNLISGLDNCFWLQCSDETALVRSKGFVFDPVMNKVYHLDFDPPPNNIPGLHERLVMTFDNSDSDAIMKEVQAKLAASLECADELSEWLCRFDKLKMDIDADETVDHITGAVEHQIEEILESKDVALTVERAALGAKKACAAAIESARLADEARKAAREAAGHLFSTKKAEVEATALVSPSGKGTHDAGADSLDGAVGLISETASAEIAALLKSAAESVEVAESAARAAEEESKEAARIAKMVAAELANTDATAEAMAQAEAAVKSALEAQDRSNEAAKNASEAAQEAAGVWKDAMQKGLSSENVPEAIAAAAAAAAAAVTANYDTEKTEVSIESDEKSLQREAFEEIDLAMREGCAEIYSKWQNVESEYFASLRDSFRSIREERSLNLAHFVDLKEKFQVLLRRPDKQQQILDSFQSNFNAIDLDMRRLEAAKAELVLRSDELRDSLWEICDSRLRAAEAELDAIVTDSYIADHSALTAGHFASIAQAEVNRGLATIDIIKKYERLQEEQLRQRVQGDATETEVPAQQQAEEEVQSKTIDVIALTSDATITSEWSNEMENLPEWASSLSEYSPSLAKAMKEALDLVRGDELEGAETDPTTTEETAINPSPLTRENEILEKRIALIAKRAVEVLHDLRGLGDRTHERLKEWMTSRFKGECSAVGALHDVVKKAIAIESELPYHLRLEGEMMILDETELVVDPTPPPPEVPEDEPTLIKGYLNCSQLAALSSLFKHEFPTGLVSTASAAYVIQRTGSISCGVTLPREWLMIDVSKLQKILSVYEIAESGLLDWREMIVAMAMASYPQVMAPSPEAIQEIGSFLSEVDLDRDGIVNADEFLSVKFWFSKHKNVLDRSQTKPSRGFDLHASLTRVLFNTFSKPMSELLPNKFAAQQHLNSGVASAEGSNISAYVVDFKAVLLYLSMDYRHRFALLKTLAVEQMGNTWQPISSRQLYNICYPHGGPPREYEEMAGVTSFTPERIDSILHTVNQKMMNDLQVHLDSIEKQNEAVIDSLMHSRDSWDKMQAGALARYKLKDAAISLSL